MLAKLVILQHPQIAAELLTFAKATGTKDLKQIQSYFNEFCRIYELDSNTFKGKHFKSDLVRKRYIFISAMINIYHPKILYVSNSTPILINGFVGALAQATGLATPTISFFIRNSILYYQAYTDFKEETDSLIIKLDRFDSLNKTHSGVEQLVSLPG